MQYSLLTSEGQWKEWQIKLKRFCGYLGRAAEALSPYGIKSTWSNHSPMWPIANTLPSMPVLVLPISKRKSTCEDPASEPAQKRLV
jgi:hypothetical protein